jgi:hypothetical protein
MTLSDVYEIPVGVSLLVIVSTLGAAVAGSLLVKPASSRALDDGAAKSPALAHGDGRR